MGRTVLDDEHVPHRTAVPLSGLEKSYAGSRGTFIKLGQLSVLHGCPTTCCVRTAMIYACASCSDRAVPQQGGHASRLHRVALQVL
eukprot:scaffold188420_cov18-Tisochrysis_lutea.AAC.2